MVTVTTSYCNFLLQPKELKLNADESKALKEESGDVTMIQVHTLNYWWSSNGPLSTLLI